MKEIFSDLKWLLLYLLCLIPFVKSVNYLPNWDSLDSRPIPNWYEDSKFGIFIHYGIFSVPSYRSEWFWWYWQGEHHADIVKYMSTNYPKIFSYADFAKEFRAEFYDPERWADIFERSGAKYVVLTTKHHEGFCLWPTKYSFNWNAMEVGPRRDIVGELAMAIRNRKTDIKFGVYHSLFEWFNNEYILDRDNNFTSRNFPEHKSLPELYELVNNYKPDLIWSDGDVGPEEYWNSTGFLAWLYNDSPVKDTVVTNDRWCNGCSCKHGGYYTCNDRYMPGKLVQHKWENCFTIDMYSWGYRREARLSDIVKSKQLIDVLIETVAFGGNLLLNVGPNSAGVIDPIFEERLMDIGDWLSTNGEAIYATRPWEKIQKDFTSEFVYYTTNSKTNYLYLLFTKWPYTAQLMVEASPFVGMLPLNGKLITDKVEEFPIVLKVNPTNSSQAVVNLNTPKYGSLSPNNISFAWVIRFNI